MLYLTIISAMKNTKELETILKNSHMEDMEEILHEESDTFLAGDYAFRDYMRKVLKEKGIRQQDVFLRADIPERYGYKLISQEKHTRQRDVILRLCYAADFTLDEVKQALKIYGMPQLYAKIPRDALLIVAFNTRLGSVLDINQFLRAHQMVPLRTSGVQN